MVPISVSYGRGEQMRLAGQRTGDETMTLAAQIANLADHIAECLELIEAAQLNFNMTEDQVIDEVAYYQQQIAILRDRKAAMEVWA